MRQSDMVALLGGLPSHPAPTGGRGGGTEGDGGRNVPRLASQVEKRAAH